MSRFFLLAIVLPLAASQASAADFTYVFKNYPKTAQGCHQAAMEVGSHFAGKAASVVSRCLSENDLGYRIEVSYEAEQALKLETTSTLLGALDVLGRYASEKACQDALSNERDLFRSETGLTPDFSYCTQERPSNEDKTNWHVFQLAFGESTRHFHVSSYSIFALPIGMDLKQYREQLFPELQKRGATPVSVVFRSRMAYADVTVTYYAAAKTRFEMAEATFTKKPEICQAQAAEARGFYADATNSPVLIYCAKGSFGMTELSILTYGQPSIRLRPSAERYATFEACDAARPKLVDYYINTLKLPVKGGLCSQQVEDDDKFAVVLFEQRKTR